VREEKGGLLKVREGEYGRGIEKEKEEVRGE
jgi:hypothetical protein